MNTNIEKIENVIVSDSKIEKPEEPDKKTTKNDQFCLKALDYFIF